MRILCLIFACLLATGCASTPDYGRPLPVDAPPLLPLDPGESVPDLSSQWAEREDIRIALERSLRWLLKPSSQQHVPVAGISHGRVVATLERLEQLFDQCADARSFQAAVNAEFEFFKSAGWNGRGDGVLFTAYYTPILEGRLEADSVFRFPLYGRPPELESTPTGEVLGMRMADGHTPFPARRTIDEQQILSGRGLEQVWLSSALDAYLAHVQGSAYVSLSDGSLLRFGYAGTNGREYTSLAAELIEAGELDKDQARLPDIQAWAQRHPKALQEYLWRNERYTFFTPIQTTPHGSLDFPVSEHRTLATDKRLFPRAAPVFVDTRISTGSGSEQRPYRQWMFDQDTGGGIRTAGRADIYVGVGETAGEIAGRTKDEGQLYYFFLREELVPRYLP